MLNHVFNTTQLFAHARVVLFQVGDHEVECQPDFRLYLQTTQPSHRIPAELAAHVSIVNFQLSRDDVTDELLDRFMVKEKQRLNDEKDSLRQASFLLPLKLVSLPVARY